MVPKASKAFALPCQLAADRLAGCRRVDARFTLAVWTLASGHVAFWTLVPSDACHYRQPVTVGTRHAWRGMARETTSPTGDDPTPDPGYSPDEIFGSRMKFGARWLSNRTTTPAAK